MWQLATQYVAMGQIRTLSAQQMVRLYSIMSPVDSTWIKA
jgi:hypothetical protein